MDLKTFIVELVKALAWPAIAIFFIFAFRKPFLALLPGLTKLKYDKFEFQFVKEVAAVEREAHTSLPPLSSDKSGLEIIRQKLVNLSMNSPGAAVVEAARYLETELIQSASRHNLELTPAVRVMPKVVAALLYKETVITEAQYDLIVRLRDLRNEVTHGAVQVDIERAISYGESVIRLVASLE
jgi:hypothetical protein